MEQSGDSDFYKYLRLRILVQRCSHAEVTIGGESQGKLQRCLMVFFGVGVVDKKHFALMPTSEIIAASGKHFQGILQRSAEKVAGLRIFSDANDKMNLSASEAGAGIYLVSQFTLFADSKKGLRPSFARSAPPAIGELFYEDFCNSFRNNFSSLSQCRGQFAADMKVAITNDGPVTILLEASHEGFL